MIKKFSVPRGTADILPDEIAAWQNLETTARRILKTYHYQEIRTPIFEDINLFVRSLGEATDVVNKQLFEVKSHEIETAEQVAMPVEYHPYALRPEGTAAVVRSYLANGLDSKDQLSKLFYIGPMFRGERPQKGRLRQFHQIGVEAISSYGHPHYLDVEILTLAMHLLKDLGVKNPRLKINSLGSKDDKERISIWLREELGKYKKDLCENCQNRFERNVFRVLDCKNESCRRIVTSVDKDLPLSVDSKSHFQAVQEAFKKINIDFEIAPYLVRGLDYYTHTVFEITADGLGSQDAVGAGGGYDGLIHELGGSPNINYGAIGFALGIERILLSKGNTIEPLNPLIAFVVSKYQGEAFRLANQLRQANISVDMSFCHPVFFKSEMSASFKSQMSRANKLNARFALILGEEEIKNGTVAVKDMVKSVQEPVNKDKIVDYLRKALC